MVSAADITAGTSYVVDLAFNPENPISGNSSVGVAPYFSGQLYSSTSHDAIYAPMINLTPVPRKSTEVSKKETYLINLGTARATRVELYYNGSDTAKTITGVNLRTIILSTDDEEYKSPSCRENAKWAPVVLICIQLSLR